MSEQVSRPEYSTAVGLVLYGARTRRLAGARPTGWYGQIEKHVCRGVKRKEFRRIASSGAN